MAEEAPKGSIGPKKGPKRDSRAKGSKGPQGIPNGSKRNPKGFKRTQRDLPDGRTDSNGFPTGFPESSFQVKEVRKTTLPPQTNERKAGQKTCLKTEMIPAADRTDMEQKAARGQTKITPARQAATGTREDPPADPCRPI